MHFITSCMPAIFFFFFLGGGGGGGFGGVGLRETMKL
jgi:hypothetical protein